MPLMPLLLVLLAPCITLYSFTVMLDPSGDARNGGREIGDCFERGICIQYAQYVKQAVEAQCSEAEVIITQVNRHVVDQLQSVNFANRLKVDLFISLHFFPHIDKPTLNIYCFSRDQGGFEPIRYPSLSLIPYDDAYLTYQSRSKECAQIMYLIANQFAHIFEVNPVACFPFKPLVGVQPPSFALEASVDDKKNWNIYLEPLVKTIISIIRPTDA